jgi:DNA-binding NarL/FixJ family response regulator
MRARVLVADGHPVVIEGLCHVFDRSEYEIAGKAQNGQAVIEAAAKLRLDAMLFT